MFTVSYDAPLMHHGVKGMKWGVRRYQNRDGSLTSAGRNRYDSNNERGGLSKRAMRKAERQKRRLAEQQALDKWLSGKKLSDAEKRVLLGKRHQSDKDIAKFDKYTSGKIHQRTVNDYNRSKKPLTAAQKAERKRKLVKGAKIAAAALGTAAVVGGTAYAVNRYRQGQGQRAKLLENPFPRSKYDPSVRGFHINTSSMRDDSRTGRSINGFRVQERPGASAGREFGVGPGFKTGSNKGSYNPTTGEYKGVYDSRIPTHTNSPKGSYTSPFARSNPGTSRGMHINTSSMRDDTRAGRTVNGYRVQERRGASAGREHSSAAGGFKTGSNKGSYNPTTGEYKGVYDSRIPTHTNSPKGSYTSPFARSNPGTSRGMHINTSSMRDDTRAGRTVNGYRVQERRGASAGREHSSAAGGFKTGSNKGSYNPTTGEYKGVYDSRIPKHTNSPKGSYSQDWGTRARNLDRVQAANSHAKSSTARARAALEKRRRRYG